MKIVKIVGLAALCCTPVHIGLAQDPIVEISFETIPGGTALFVEGGAITLAGDVLATQDLSATGTIESTVGGYRFPDGTVQLTAAVANSAGYFSANQGLYNNRIPDFLPPNPYTEICFKSSGITADIHVTSEPPNGGQCEPGDVGYIIERDERPESLIWAEARVACLVDGMRLLEPFEWQLGCINADSFGISAMIDDEELASNSTHPFWINNVFGRSVTVLGNGACDYGSMRWVNRTDGNPGDSVAFRCAL